MRKLKYLAATLLEAGLIDEVILKLNPLLMGAGVPLFVRVEEPVHLELIASKAYPNGVLLLSYRVKAPVHRLTPPSAPPCVSRRVVRGLRPRGG